MFHFDVTAGKVDLTDEALAGAGNCDDPAAENGYLAVLAFAYLELGERRAHVGPVFQELENVNCCPVGGTGHQGLRQFRVNH